MIPEARAIVLMRSSAINANCGFEVAKRSCPSKAFAMRQPSCSFPTRFSAGTITSSKNTSLNSSSPAIVLIGLILNAWAVQIKQQEADAGLPRLRLRIGAH